LSAWRIEPDGLLLQVRVTPKGGRDDILGLRVTGDGRFHLAVKIAAPPRDGAANEALRRLIANELGLSRSAVTIIAGEQSREKRLKLSGDPVAILTTLKTMGFDE
jgi:uncharacterized protein